jgi:hypothetical protein
VESPSSRDVDAGGSEGAVPAGPQWRTSPRFWLAAIAAVSFVLGIAFGIEAIAVGPVRIGFGASAVVCLLAAAACGWSAVTGRVA